LYIHTRTYNEFFVIYIGSFDTPSSYGVGSYGYFTTISSVKSHPPSSVVLPCTRI